MFDPNIPFSENGPVFDDESVRTLKLPPAALGLGLCDTRRIMSPENIAALDKDLADIARARQTLPEGWDTDLITGH